MKKLLFFLTMCMTFSFATILTGQGSYNPNQIIIDFADGVTQQDIDEYLDLINGVIIDQIGDDIFLVEVESFPIEYTDINGVEVVLYNVVDIIEGNHNNSEIDDTDFNYDISNNPMNFGQIVESLPFNSYTPIPGYVNDYPGLLNCSNIQQNQKVKVGIIDTGIDDDHSFIMDYVVFQANVYDDEQVAVDEHGHGTGVAGIIAGLAKASGITPEYLELYIIKALDENGQGDYFNMIRAVQMANELDLDILNLSWGFYYDFVSEQNGYIESSTPTNTASVLKDALGNASMEIIICGAGNDGIFFSENVEINYGPADFEDFHLTTFSPGLITVGAVNSIGEIADFSSYGDPVDLYAPGTEILTPSLNGYWILNNSGTSFSSAIVTAVALQYWVSCELNLITENTVMSGDGGVIGGTSLPNSNEQTSTADIVFELIMNNTIVLGSYTIQNGRNQTDTSIEGIDLSMGCNENSYSSFSQPVYNDNNFLVETMIEKTQSNKNIIEVFPNPFSVNPKIKLMDFEKGPFMLQLLDLQGKQIYNKQGVIEENSDVIVWELDLKEQNIPKGIYILQVNQKDKLVHFKLIKS